MLFCNNKVWKKKKSRQVCSKAVSVMLKNISHILQSKGKHITANYIRTNWFPFNTMEYVVTKDQHQALHTKQHIRCIKILGFVKCINLSGFNYMETTFYWVRIKELSLVMIKLSVTFKVHGNWSWGWKSRFWRIQ